MISNQFQLGSMVRLVYIMKKDSLKEIKASNLVRGAMQGMADSLNDPYSSYLSSNDYKELNERLAASFGGVGIVMAPNDKDQIVVVAPIKKTPAERAGIKSGDIITKINGKSTEKMNPDQAVQLIRGKNGTRVKLSVYREKDQKEYSFNLVRRKINVPSVDSKIVKKEPKIAYIQIVQFTSKTPEEFLDQLNNMMDKGMEGLIIDLRDDPGGDFGSAVEIADTIMDKGNIVKIVNREGTSEVYSSTPGGINVPIAVLVNKGSASAAEILSGALKDNGLAVLVGEKTYGKGLVQTVYPLMGGDALKLTTQKYFTPRGIDINRKGIAPDYVVTALEDSEEDTQLDKAISLIADKIQ
ncbi:MAG: S41 family peptidase [Chitinophagales bacterium]